MRVVGILLSGLCAAIGVGAVLGIGYYGLTLLWWIVGSVGTKIIPILLGTALWFWWAWQAYDSGWVVGTPEHDHNRSVERLRKLQYEERQGRQSYEERLRLRKVQSNSDPVTSEARRRNDEAPVCPDCGHHWFLHNPGRREPSTLHLGCQHIECECEWRSSKHRKTVFFDDIAEGELRRALRREGK